jgi:ELWxxDGT repeat protein
MKKIILLFLLSQAFSINSQNIPVLVKDINPGFLNGFYNSYSTNYKLAPFGKKLVVVANNGRTGEALFLYNPLNDSLTLLKDIDPDAFYFNIYNLKEIAGKLFFSCDDGTHGLELWASDGTANNTTILKDIYPNKDDGLTEYSSNLAFTPKGMFFAGFTPQYSVELWFSDGTSIGTKLVKDIEPGTGFGSPSDLCYNSALDLLFFSASSNLDTEPFISNGTSSGTKLLKNIASNTGERSKPYRFTNFNNKVIFSTQYNFDFSTGFEKNEIYITDGTATGTIPLFFKNLKYDNKFSNFTQSGDKVYFSIKDELFVTDGTITGTKSITNKLNFNNESSFISFKNKMLFTAFDSLIGMELYITDGNSNPVLIKDIYPGTENSDILNMIEFNNKIYFSATSSQTAEQELWETDGTTAGTKMVYKINPSGGSYVDDFAILDSTLYFTAYDSKIGSELWKLNAKNVVANENSNLESGITIYPNPCTSNFFIESQFEIEHIELINSNGQITMSNIHSNEYVNTSMLSSGLYCLKIYLKDHNTITKKIIIQ